MAEFNFSDGLTYDTPLAMMTLGQLLDVISKYRSGCCNGDGELNEIENTDPNKDEDPYIYGILGICRFFKVGYNTAVRWRRSWLSPACSRGFGGGLIVDREKALELFKQTGRDWDSYQNNCPRGWRIQR